MGQKSTENRGPDRVTVRRLAIAEFYLLPFPLLAGSFFALRFARTGMGQVADVIAMVAAVVLVMAIWTYLLIVWFDRLQRRPKLLLDLEGIYVAGTTKGAVPWNLLGNITIHSNHLARHGKDVFVNFHFHEDARSHLQPNFWSRLKQGFLREIFETDGIMISTGSLDHSSRQIMDAANRLRRQDDRQ